MQSEGEFRRAVAKLVRSDSMIAATVREFGMPDFWYRPPGFATLVLFILEQQVSLASGAAAFRRLHTRIGTVTPEAVLVPNDEELRADGFSRQKTRYVRELARSVLTGEVDLEQLSHVDDGEVRARLTKLIGIGPWTADVYLLSCLRRPDVWPVFDRALQVAASEVLDLGAIPDPIALEALGERWRPHRSTAARLLWHSYLARRGRAEVSFVGL
ncbi:MAG TPA: DNA-3-methyladenine glycosylase 2 family protein [Acidimicrobiia bacterium]|nr:DNA-3-methyladenine glycosylase 2 family protein [Acidimicrobiia bacterium]